jgi:hypothetical protein
MGEAAARQRRLPADPRITITAQMKSISLAIAIALLPGLAAAQSAAAGTVMEDGDIVINMKAVEELAGARTAAEIAARLNPTRPFSLPWIRRSRTRPRPGASGCRSSTPAEAS